MDEDARLRTVREALKARHAPLRRERNGAKGKMTEKKGF